MSSGGTIINERCGQVDFTSNQGAFTSPVYWLNHELSCDYQITVAAGATIKFMFVLMALHEPTHRELFETAPPRQAWWPLRCRREYVKLYDGPFSTLGDNRNADRICGHQEPEIYHSTGHHYTIQFVTRNLAYSDGFKVKWSAVYAPSQRIDFAGCGLRGTPWRHHARRSAPGDITKRMINGQNADQYSWPSVCRLIICNEEDGGHQWCNLCTGTLVRNLNGYFHLITSASCFVNIHSVYTLENSYAYCGFHVYRKHHWRNVRFRFIRITSHDDYTEIREDDVEDYAEDGIGGSDIAVVELAFHTTPTRIIPNRSIQAACLPNEGHLGEDEGVGVGWGTNFHGRNVGDPYYPSNGGGFAKKLQQVNVTIVDDDKCFREYDGSTHPGYHKGMDICVTTEVMSGRRRGHQVGPLCKGDDGGPLLSSRSGTWVIVGVARGQDFFFDDCGFVGHGLRNRTDVYVDVFYFRDWINENINYCVNSENCTRDKCVMNIFGECRSLKVVDNDWTDEPPFNYKQAAYALRLCKMRFGNEARLPEVDTTSDLDKIFSLSKLVRNPVGNMWFGNVSAHRGGINDTMMWLWPSGNRVDSSLWSPAGQPAFQGGVAHFCTHADQYNRGLRHPRLKYMSERTCTREGRESNIVCSVPHTRGQG